MQREPFNQSKHREMARSRLAIGLTLLLATTLLIISIQGFWIIKTVQDAIDLLGVILAPLVGLVGAATGFYYGGKE